MSFTWLVQSLLILFNMISSKPKKYKQLLDTTDSSHKLLSALKDNDTTSAAHITTRTYKVNVFPVWKHQSSAEMSWAWKSCTRSVRLLSEHFGTNAKMSGRQCRNLSALVPTCIGAKVSWVWSVRKPNYGLFASWNFRWQELQFPQHPTTLTLNAVAIVRLLRNRVFLTRLF